MLQIDRLACRNPMQPSQLNYMNSLRPTMATGSELVPFLRSKESGMSKLPLHLIFPPSN